jgi:hypothetical protein
MRSRSIFEALSKKLKVNRNFEWRKLSKYPSTKEILIQGDVFLLHQDSERKESYSFKKLVLYPRFILKYNVIFNQFSCLNCRMKQNLLMEFYIFNSPALKKL